MSEMMNLKMAASAVVLASALDAPRSRHLRISKSTTRDAKWKRKKASRKAALKSRRLNRRRGRNKGR